MRVDAYNKINQMYQTNKSKKTTTLKKGNEKDSLEISKNGQSYNYIKQVVGSTPDIREDIVSRIKNELVSGTYNISDNDLAERILEKGFDQKI